VLELVIDCPELHVPVAEAA